MLQLASDIATGFNQKKLPHCTVCVAVDLTAAFDTDNHNVLLSNIVKSTLSVAVKLINNNNINNNNICLKSNIQTSSVDCAPRELTHACR